MSPTLMPMRNWMRVSAGTAALRSPMPARILGRAAKGIHDATEFHEQPVACRLDQPAVVRGNGRINQLGPGRLERLESTALIHADQS